MDFQTFRIRSLDYPLFRYTDILKWFPQDKEATIKQNLKYWLKKKLIERLIKGVYKLKETEFKDEFLIASYLDYSSYISLESALSYYGMIPEYPYAVTSVTLTKTKKFNTAYGIFSYRKIKKELFFGFGLIAGDNYWYKLATPEKALFDFIYFQEKFINRGDFFQETRLSLPKNFNKKIFFSYLKYLKNKKLLPIIKAYVNHQ